MHQTSRKKVKRRMDKRTAPDGNQGLKTPPVFERPVAKELVLGKKPLKKEASRFSWPGFMFFCVVAGVSLLTLLVMVIAVINVVSPATFHRFKLSVAAKIAEEDIDALLSDRDELIRTSKELEFKTSESESLKNNVLKLQESEAALQSQLRAMEGRVEELRKIVGSLSSKMDPNVEKEVTGNETEIDENGDVKKDVVVQSDFERFFFELRTILDEGINKWAKAKTSADRDEISEESKDLLVEWCKSTSGKKVAFTAKVQDIRRRDTRGGYVAVLSIEEKEPVDSRFRINKSLQLPIDSDLRKSLEPGTTLKVEGIIKFRALDIIGTPEKNRPVPMINDGDPNHNSTLFSVRTLHETPFGVLNLGMDQSSDSLFVKVSDLTISVATNE